MPPCEHCRPAALQSNSQQRPSSQLEPEPEHWAFCVHPVPPRGMRLLQSPVLVLQPFPQGAVMNVLFTQLRELPT